MFCREGGRHAKDEGFGPVADYFLADFSPPAAGALLVRARLLRPLPHRFRQNALGGLTDGRNARGQKTKKNPSGQE